MRWRVSTNNGNNDSSDNTCITCYDDKDSNDSNYQLCSAITSSYSKMSNFTDKNGFSIPRIKNIYNLEIEMIVQVLLIDKQIL